LTHKSRLKKFTSTKSLVWHYYVVTQLAKFTKILSHFSGNFVCPACQHKGAWSLLEKFFNPPKKSLNSTNELKKYQELFLESNSKQQPKPLNVANLTPISNYTTVQLDQIADHFNLQLPSAVLLRITGVLYEDQTKTLYVPLLDVDSRITGYKLLSKAKDSTIIEKTLPEHNTSGLVVVNNSTSGSRIVNKDAILVLNIFDVLALSTQKIKDTIICLPYGMKSLPQECLPALDKYQKLILWFNYDTAGWDTARNFAKKLDEKRCMFVR
jgi:twinkle protein